MWFKYFNKSTWDIRLWKTLNLKYNADSYGYFQYHWMSKIKNLYYKVIGNEGSVRTISFLLLVSFGSIYSHYDEQANGEKNRMQALKEEQEVKERERQEIQDKFYINR